MAQVQLTINEKPIAAEEGLTILDVCRKNDIFVPTLCFLEGLSNVGACRLCIVEVEGQRRPVPACTTPAADAMVIRTATPQLEELRRHTLELLFSERNHICPFCPRSGHCELQNAGYKAGIDHVRYDYFMPVLPTDNSHPRIALDHNRCILCTRCIRACDEWIGAHVLDLDLRGAKTMLVADNGVPLGESSCVSCGTCVSVCPTGALFEKRSAHWQGRLPLAFKETICPGCGVGCRVKASVRHRQIGGLYSAGGPDGNRVLCERGRFKLVDPKTPRVPALRIKQGNAWVEKSMPDVVAACVRRLNHKPVKDDPNRVVAFVSPRLPLETIAVAESFITRVVGSTQWSVVDRTNAPAVRKAFELNGTVAPLAGLRDLDEADMILLLGCNLERPHGVVASYVRRAALHRRVKLVKINPKHTWLTGWTDLHIRSARGRDAAILGAILKYLLDAGRTKAPIDDALRKQLAALDDDTIEIKTGVPAGHLRDVARMYGEAKRPVIIVGRGLTRGDTDGMAAALDLVHACDQKTASGRWRLMELAMGANSVGARLLAPSDLDIRMFDPHNADVAFVLLDDDEITWPREWIEMLRTIAFVVAMSARENAVTELAHVVVPTAGWAERSGTYVNLEGRLQKAHALMEPMDGCVEETAFFETLAKAWRGADCGWSAPGLPPALRNIADGNMVPCERHATKRSWAGLSALTAE